MRRRFGHVSDRVTHLDYLADKLREDRVRRIIEPSWEQRIYRMQRGSAHLRRGGGGAVPVTVWGM